MLKALKWPFLYVVIQLTLILLWAIGYTLMGQDPNHFATIFTKYQIVLVILMAIILLPLLIKEYSKKKNKKEKIEFKNIIVIICFGVILSLVYNVLAFYIDKVLLTGTLYQENEYLLTTLIRVGIIGPILEELLFRGIMYRDLKEKYSNMQSILICTIIFSLFHANIMQMIYAFAIGFLLIYVYEKYQTIKAPIILHMASNIATTLFLPLLIQNHFWLNYGIYLVSLIIITILFLYYRKNLKEK